MCIIAPDAIVTTDANTLDHPGEDIRINLPVSSCTHPCHAERSEASHMMGNEMLRCAQHDKRVLFIPAAFWPNRASLSMTSGTYKSEISTDLRKMPVTTDATDANVTNSPKFGTVNPLYRTPPDPCGSYRHSFREQSQGNQPVVVQAAQLALVSILPVDLPHRKPQIWTIPDD